MYVEGDEVRVVATQITESALSEDDLEQLIIRASRIFDLVCGVEPGYFEGVGTATTASNKVIYGDGTNYLRLPPYIPGSLSTTITLPAGYTAPEFIERNGYLIRASNGSLPGSGYRAWSFGLGWIEGLPITVSAKWGYAETPEDVKHAVIELVINLWREVDPAQVKLVNIEGQPLRERMPPRVAEIARRYRTAKGVAFV